MALALSTKALSVSVASVWKSLSLDCRSAHLASDYLQSAAAQLELCISEVGQWMAAANRLTLNSDKTADMDRTQGKSSPARSLSSGTTTWSQLHSGQ